MDQLHKIMTFYPKPNNFFYSCCFSFSPSLPLFLSSTRPRATYKKPKYSGARDTKKDYVMTYDCQNTSKSELYNERSCISKFATCQFISRD